MKVVINQTFPGSSPASPDIMVWLFKNIYSFPMIPIKLSLGAQAPQAQCDGKPTKTNKNPFTFNSTVDLWAWEHFIQGIFYSIWWATENLLSNLGILL